MTYPTQQPGFPAPAQPQYPTAQPAPQAYAPPPMGYPAPQYPAQQPGYPVAPQGYPMAPPQPQVPLATGSLDAFFSQPQSGGGPSLKFDQVGTSYVGIVAREITSADVQQQTDFNTKAPQFYRDGRPKFSMRVPLLVQASAAFPEGQAQWFVKGNTGGELQRAMKEAGAPDGAPEKGALIQVTFTGTRASGPGLNPSKVFQVVYQRPQGAPAAPPTPPQAPAAAPVAPTAQAPAQQFQAPVPPPVAPQQVAPQQQQQAAQPPAAPQFDPSQLPAMGADQQALLAQLTGQQPVPQG